MFAVLYNWTQSKCKFAASQFRKWRNPPVHVLCSDKGNSMFWPICVDSISHNWKQRGYLFLLLTCTAFVFLFTDSGCPKLSAASAEGMNPNTRQYWRDRWTTKSTTNWSFHLTSHITWRTRGILVSTNTLVGRKSFHLLWMVGNYPGLDGLSRHQAVSWVMFQRSCTKGYFRVWFSFNTVCTFARECSIVFLKPRVQSVRAWRLPHPNPRRNIWVFRVCLDDWVQLAVLSGVLCIHTESKAYCISSENSVQSSSEFIVTWS